MRSPSFRLALPVALLSLAAACGTVGDAHQVAGSTGSGGAASTSSTVTSSSTGAGGSGGGVGTGGAGGAPASGPDTYQALGLFTNVPRFALLKASPQRNLCFRLIVVTGAGMGIPGLSGNVTVESGLVTHDVADCQVAGAPLPVPAGATVPVVSGHGTLSISGPPGVCTTTVHAQVQFSGAPAWVPPSEALDADGLTIVGGCP